jgi:hypothetical protein
MANAVSQCKTNGDIRDVYYQILYVHKNVSKEYSPFIFRYKVTSVRMRLGCIDGL